MKDFLTVKEIMQIKGCSKQAVHKMIASGIILSNKVNIGTGKAQHLIPVDSLPEDLKAAYYGQFVSKSTSTSTPKQNTAKPSAVPVKAIDELTEAQRAEYAFWSKTVADWKSYRSLYKGSITEADKHFLSQFDDSEYKVSRSILYRKEKQLATGNPYEVVDHRGGHNKGSSTIPAPVWDWFLSTYLDQRRLALAQVYEAVKNWCQMHHEELVSCIPSESAFRRKLKDVPEALITLGRYGEKAFQDRHQPYIQRLYDDLLPNDYWVGDNHTLDIISKRDDGSNTTHRLYLTAFIDARSSVMVGWYVTDAPSSQSTIYALRHAILRFGIPKAIYLDNGSEFLTHDLAGRGHRRRKSQEGKIEPPHIFARLGIEMTNAIVKNAKAKPVERTFYTFKGQISSLFETFTGGSVTSRPEILSKNIKNGKVPLDSELRSMLDDLIDGGYNQGTYGGAIKKDHGKTRLQVWNEYVQEVRRANEDDLNLMLLRTSRPQKVGRNGVYLTISGEKLFYWQQDYWKLQGKLVYVRYDPQNLDTVRLYEAETDKFIGQWDMAKTTRIKFAATNDEVKVGVQDVNAVKKEAKASLRAIKAAVPKHTTIDILDIQLRAAAAAREGMIIQQPKRIVPISADEPAYQPLAMVAGDVKTVDISAERMKRNAARRTGKE